MIVWSPLLLAVGPALAADDVIATLVATGEGSGAMAVVAIGMCGGCALSRRGPVWGRAVSGLVAVGATTAMASMLAIRGHGGPASAVFGGIHVGILMVWLAVGCALPLRQHPIRSRPS